MDRLARPRVRPPAAIAAVVLLAAACGSDSSTGPGARAPRIALLQIGVPIPIQLTEGETTSVSIRALDAQGRPVPGASTFIHAESSDPSVVAPVGTGGGIAPAQADGVLTIQFRAVGPGTATIRISYPCPVSDPACDPDHVLDAPVEVRAAVAGFLVEPEGPVLLAVGGSTTLTVQTVDSRGDPAPAADGEIQFESTAPEAFGVSRNDGTPGDGRVTVTLRGLAEGGGVLRISHPRVDPSLEIPVLVLVPVDRVVIDPADVELQPGLSAILTIRALDEAGRLVFGAELGLSVRTTDPEVVRIVASRDIVPGDGEVQVTIEGVAEGTARIEATYPDADAAEAEVRVLAAGANAPGPERIPGGYTLTGTLRDDTCGDAAPSLSGPPGSLVRAEVFLQDGKTMVRLTVGEEIYVDDYDLETGDWEGETTITRADGTRVRKKHEGRWQVAPDLTTVFRGILVIEPLDAEGDPVCRTRYDVEYRRVSG